MMNNISLPQQQRAAMPARCAHKPSSMHMTIHTALPTYLATPKHTQKHRMTIVQSAAAATGTNHKTSDVHPDLESVLFTEEQIQEAVTKLGRYDHIKHTLLM